MVGELQIVFFFHLNIQTSEKKSDRKKYASGFGPIQWTVRLSVWPVCCCNDLIRLHVPIHILQ